MEKTGKEEVQRWTQENHEERESRVKKKEQWQRGRIQTRGGGGNRKKEIGRGGKMQGEKA